VSRRGALVVPVSVLMLGACAPIASYSGLNPSPGGVQAVLEAAAVPAERGGTPRRRLVAAGPAADGAPARDSVTVLLYGDNRGGYRMQYHTTEYRAVTRMLSSGLGGFAKGLLYTPILLIESFIPTLDGPRDLVTTFTRSTRAGGEAHVLDAMKPFLPADLVISTGDLVTDGRRGRLWESFVSRHRALRTENLYLAAPGNHERLYDATAAASWDAAIGPAPEPGCRWYRADLNDVGARFVILDSDLLADVHGNYGDSTWAARANAQLDFAEVALSSPMRWKFVVLHHPPVSSGHYEQDWLADRPGDPVPRRCTRLLEMCARHRVTAVFAGHEHLFQRFYVVDKSGAGFWQVISGGGGAPLYPIEKAAFRQSLMGIGPSQFRVVPESARGRSTFHFCRIQFPPSGAGPLRMDVYRARPGGEVEHIDQVDLAAPPSPGKPGS
jgi:hypothetical protein